MMEMIQQDQVGAPGIDNVRDPDWLRNNLENEEGVLQFLDDPNNQLEDQPTEVLIELAQKLKERQPSTTTKCFAFKLSKTSKPRKKKRKAET